ncbi:DUF126 domain-containing protein [Methanoculleus sp. Wushi-C6]|uniref:Phosphomevalonate dehydratase small subunit n=1 Tax=Methanoculleus caldifontis TaxID=2651577 RepID=A0ABU3X356_9EURY|nr:DUF126 domain-containing protein [Methanoculleus sp. Wushi-C6]MDV2482371.1 DUF126 domain-containing protein [Methanoculleus sp. Wushi-C6]
MKGRSISRGIGSGDLLVSPEPISFLSGVDPETGIVVEHGHPLEGQSIAGRVLAFPHGKGSTVGSYVIYALKQNNLAPAAIINTEAEPIIAVGAIIAGIPMVDRLPPAFSRLAPGTMMTVNGDTGEVSYDETA